MLFACAVTVGVGTALKEDDTSPRLAAGGTCVVAVEMALRRSDVSTILVAPDIIGSFFCDGSVVELSAVVDEVLEAGSESEAGTGLIGMDGFSGVSSSSILLSGE